MVIGSSKQEISHQIFQTELTLGPSPWPPWQRISLNITDTRYSVVHTYTQHAIHYTEHWYTHYPLQWYTLTQNMLYTTQNIYTYTQHATHYTQHCYTLLIHIFRYSDTHFHRTCYTLHRKDTMHITEHWYWCTLHRTLVQIAQNIDAHCIEHLHTLHRTFTHTQSTHTLNIFMWHFINTQ